MRYNKRKADSGAYASRLSNKNMWKQWVNFIVGVIIVIMALTSSMSETYYLIGGIIVAVLSIWAALGKKGA